MADPANSFAFSAFINGVGAFYLENQTEQVVRSLGLIFKNLPACLSAFMVYQPNGAVESFVGSINGQSAGPVTPK